MPNAHVRTTSLFVVLCCFSSALLIGVWTSTISQVNASRERAIDGAGQDATSYARVIEEHTVRTIQSADQAVHFIKYEYQTAPARLDLSRLVKTGVILDDIFNLYSVIDANGDLVLSTKSFAPVNLAYREHVRVHLERPDVGLFISKPVLGRVSNKWSIQLTRRVDRPDGGFGGVVVVSMDPFYFTRLYESAAIGSHSVVTLVGADGVVRARRSGSTSEIGHDLSGSTMLNAIGKRSNGILQIRSPIDGRERVYAFRRLDIYPLLIIVGIDVEDTVAATLPLQRELVIQALISSCAIMLFTGVLVFLIRRLIRSRARAIQANAAKTQFLSNMSHELRTPLNGILGYAELLSFDLKDDEHREYARIIHESGSHLLSLVNQLLQLNKIEAGHEALLLSSENLHALAASAVNAHRSSALKKSLRLELKIAPDVPEQVECDRAKLVQVLHNLLHNAIKFTTQGEVRLTLSRYEGCMVFAVSDTGRGIPPGLQDRIFEKFFQVDAGDARLSDGSGLGLALVRKLVDLMGGHVSVHSMPGDTTFRFTLPCSAAGGDECHSIEHITETEAA